MKVEIRKSFALSNREFKKGEIIDIPVSTFHKLSLRGLLKPYLPNVSEEKLPLLKAEFERAFSEHIGRLKKIPITVSEIKQLYPERYKKLKQLEAKIDEAWLTFDYETFTEALKAIENLIIACSIYKEATDSQGSESIQRELDRTCINCGGNQWFILKPQSRTSAIRCVNCNHIEIYIKGNSEKQV